MSEETEVSQEDFQKACGFKVYLIESPKPTELLHSVEERGTLHQALQLAGIETQSLLAVDDACFTDALNIIHNDDALPNKRITVPVIHLSMHGSDEGIALTSGARISWSSLADRLRPLNLAKGNCLTICMSTCMGSSAYRMAQSVSKEPPFLALVGPNRTVGWQESLTAHTVLYYHLLSKVIPLNEAVPIMNQAIGENDVYQYFSGTEIQKEFTTRLKDLIRRMKDH